MPLYEFKCQECGHTVEELLPITEVGGEQEPSLTCLRCLAKMQRVAISSCSFHLKGGGWYITDYKGK